MAVVKTKWTITAIPAWTKSPWRKATTRKKRKKSWPAEPVAGWLLAWAVAVGWQSLREALLAAVLAHRAAEEELLVRQRIRRVPQRKRLPRKPRRRNQQRKKPRRRNRRLVAVRAERERNRLPVVARKKQARAERRNSHPWLYGREAVRRWRTSLQESCCNESVIYCAVEQSESKEKAAIYVAAFSFAECLFALDFSVCLEQR